MQLVLDLPNCDHTARPDAAGLVDLIPDLLDGKSDSLVDHRPAGILIVVVQSCDEGSIRNQNSRLRAWKIYGKGK